MEGENFSRVGEATPNKAPWLRACVNPKAFRKNVWQSSLKKFYDNFP